MSSLLSIHTHIKSHSLSIYDVEKALSDVKELEKAHGIEITLDIESNTIRMSVSGWDFQSEAVGTIGHVPPPCKLSNQSGTANWLIPGATSSYERMVQIMQKLSLLSESDQQKLCEILKKPKEISDILDAIDKLAQSLESTSKKLQELLAKLCLEQEAEIREREQERRSKVKLSTLNEYTNEKYSFSVYNLDNKARGASLIAMVSFDPYRISTPCIDGRIFGHDSLKGLNVSQIADLFHKILKAFESTKFGNHTFVATSIFLKLNQEDTMPDNPILKILGKRV